MPHPQQIPAKSLYWEHTHFEGRRFGKLGDDSPRRWWGVSYAGFASAEESDAFPDTQPIVGSIPSRVRGELVDRFFWDADLKQYTQTEAQVGACLHWYFTGKPTESELANTENMEFARARMAGTTLFGAFVVTPLPDERKPENE